MRKPVQAVLIIALVLLVVATGVLFVKYQQTSDNLSHMKVAEQTARDQYAETIDAIAEIQDSLSAIALGDTAVSFASPDLETQQRGPSDGREALDRIAVLRASILRSKARIRDLEANLKQSGIKVAGLQRMIGHLKQSVTEKETMIASLSTRVDSLATEVTGLATKVEESQQTIAARDQAIEEKRRELATVYYVVGTKKDLTTTGVVIAKGGVLGMGKTLQPTGRANEAQLTPLDTDAQTVVTIPAPKAQVLSAQPPASYELRLVGNQLELHILDPREFRKVKQLVIMTA